MAKIFTSQYRAREFVRSINQMAGVKVVGFKKEGRKYRIVRWK